MADHAADEFIAAKRSLMLNGVFYRQDEVIDKTRLTQAQVQSLLFWGLIAPVRPPQPPLAPEPEPEPNPEPEPEPESEAT